jgi:hypothetical protein
MRYISLGALSCLIAAGVSMTTPALVAQASGAEAAIAKLETERIDAVIKGDRATLDRIFADDLSYVHASGRVDTKATMLADVAAGRMKYKKFDRTDVRVRAYAASAIVTGRAAVDVDIDKKNLVLNILFTGFYVKQPDGSWRMVAWQSTRLPD